MKQVFLLLLLTASTAVTSQIVNIPDPLFKEALLNQINPTINTNGDNEIQLSEAQAATIIKVSNSEFTDLTGIEAFMNLEEIWGQNFEFEALDLSANNNLERISISIGPLTEIILPSETNTLEYFSVWGTDLSVLPDINNYVNLSSVSVRSNPNLAELNVSGLTNLEYLSLNGTAISSLDLSENLDLILLAIENTNISTIDLTPLSLTTLSFGESVQSINLASQNLLEELEIYGLGLPSLDISTNVQLKRLLLNEFPFTNINLSSNSNLEELVINNGELLNLDLQSNVALKELEVYSILLQNINLSGCVQLERLTLDHMQSLQSLDLTNNTNLLGLKFLGIKFIGQANNIIETLDLSQNSSLVEVEVLYFDNLTNFIIEGADALRVLEIGYMPLESLDLSTNPDLSRVQYRAMPIPLVDLSQNQNLESFSLRFMSTEEVIYPSINNIKHIVYFGLTWEEMDFSSFNALCRLRVQYNLNLEKINLTNADLANMASGSECYTTPNPFGNNQPLPSDFIALDNPQLSFICVDDVAFATANLDAIEAYTTYTEDCSLSGSTLNTINGELNFDLAGNSCATGASPLPSRLVLAEGDEYIFGTTTNEMGEYELNVGEGNYTTYVPNFSGVYNVNPENAVNNFVGYGQTETEDFCVEAAKSVNDLNIAITANNQPTPGGSAFYSLVYENAGTTPRDIKITMTYDDSKLNFIDASILPTSQTSNTLIWELGVLNPILIGDIGVVFNLPEEPINQVGDNLSFTATIEPVNGDTTPGDNTFTLGDTIETEPFWPIVNSSQPGQVLMEEVDEYIYFSIGFDNLTPEEIENAVISFPTGGSTYINPETVQVMAAGNPIETLFVDGTFYFYMKNINLQTTLSAGANEQGSLSVRFKPVENITPGTYLSFRPEVSLDGYLFNEFTSVQYVTELGAEENIQPINEIVLYPNPTSGIFTISATQNIQEISIFSITGQSLKSIPSDQANEISVNIEDFAAGVYFVRVVSAEGEKVFRVLKR
ncbi:MAG: hypothetical protein CMC13_10655 [Flavobacteriaceae bacterium]|nr:hypothetical protein [Flavobacteriaceae bacterium]|tara:strand:+ start:13024 stop:16035 length:3012 start_codon:yes stop_codon:yes gene_type:complete